ncbi:SDR family NAD(P)-dependent oxidoreductase [Cellulomonas sp. 179-A 9B4 NHS]|uniref:SDR family NAD(P)-dependent oxidoreductase n=1 Tax=Cellulomonas sp. 179-A 9B4 NHS TaxID=3142379 RepID=UPI0039A0EDE7
MPTDAVPTAPTAPRRGTSPDRGTARRRGVDRRTLTWTRADVPDLTGRRALVTGASSGLGAALAADLAAAGADVVLAVRDERRGEAVRDRLLGAGARGDVTVERVDVADLASVRALAARVGDRPLDALVHNAGTGGAPKRSTVGGHEVMLATHVLGPHVLTHGLRDALEAAPAGRVVTVGSAMYRLLRRRVDLTDLGAARRWSPPAQYSATKLAQMVLARERGRRLATDGSTVRSVVVHPNVARTPLQSGGSTPLMRVTSRVLAALMARTVEQAVLPLLMAAVADDAPADRVLAPGGPRTDTRVVAERHATVDDPAVGAALWAEVERLTA